MQIRSIVEHLGKSLIDVAVPRGQQDTRPGLAFQALGVMLKRLDHVASRKALQEMLGGDADQGAIEKVLPKSMAPLGHAIKMWREVEDQQKALDDGEHDFSLLSAKLGYFESLYMASINPIMTDPMFSDMREPIKAYVTTFLETSRKALQGLGPSILGDIQVFTKKYQQVVECAETWQMDPVNHLFEDEALKTMSEEVKALHSSLDNLGKLLESMKIFLSQTSSCDQMMALANEGKKFSSDAATAKKTACKAAATMMVASVYLTTDTSEIAERLQEILTIVSEDLKITKEELPSKFKQMVNDALNCKPKRKRSKKAEEGEGDEVPRENKKGKKAEKEKEKTKAKAESEKPKKRKSR